MCYVSPHPLCSTSRPHPSGSHDVLYIPIPGGPMMCYSSPHPMCSTSRPHPSGSHDVLCIPIPGDPMKCYAAYAPPQAMMCDLNAILSASNILLCLVPTPLCSIMH